MTLEDTRIKKIVCVKFQASNNEVVYEALITGLLMAMTQEATTLQYLTHMTRGLQPRMKECHSIQKKLGLRAQSLKDVLKSKSQTRGRPGLYSITSRWERAKSQTHRDTKKSVTELYLDRGSSEPPQLLNFQYCTSHPRRLQQKWLNSDPLI